MIYNYMCTHTSYSPYSGEGATVSRPYRYSHGSEQQFTEEAYTVAPAEMEEQMTYDPENGQSTFPIAVLMETARNEGLGNRSKVVDKFISCLAPPHLPPSPPFSPLPPSLLPDNRYQSQLTLCGLDKFGENGFTIKVLKQKLWVREHL